MKQIITIAALLLITFSNAQSITVNDQPIEDIDVEFVEIVGIGKLFSNKVTIQIDFGQNTKFFSARKETMVKDKEGKQVVFNSMVDALNFMSDQGFEFVQAYAYSMGNQNVFHYLMKNSKR